MSAAIRSTGRTTASTLPLLAFVLSALVSWVVVTPRRRASTPLAGSDGLILV